MSSLTAFILLMMIGQCILCVCAYKLGFAFGKQEQLHVDLLREQEVRQEQRRRRMEEIKNEFRIHP